MLGGRWSLRGRCCKGRLGQRLTSQDMHDKAMLHPCPACMHARPAQVRRKNVLTRSTLPGKLADCTSESPQLLGRLQWRAQNQLPR